MIRYSRKYFSKLGLILGTGINVFCVGHCIFTYGAEITFVSLIIFIFFCNFFFKSRWIILKK